MSERAGGRSDAPKPSYRFGAAGVVIDRLAKCLSHSKNKQVCIRFPVAVQTVVEYIYYRILIFDNGFDRLICLTLTRARYSIEVPGCTNL